MVRPRSRARGMRARPQVQYQECLSYSSPHRLSSLRSFSPSAKPFNAQPAPKPDRRRGFSSRATAAVFVATFINFLLSSLNTGSQVAYFIVFTRKVLILDTNYPLSEKRELVKNTLRNANIVNWWAEDLSVSNELSLEDPVSIHTRWRY